MPSAIPEPTVEVRPWKQRLLEVEIDRPAGVRTDGPAYPIVKELFTRAAAPWCNGPATHGLPSRDGKEIARPSGNERPRDSFSDLQWDCEEVRPIDH